MVPDDLPSRICNSLLSDSGKAGQAALISQRALRRRPCRADFEIFPSPSRAPAGVPAKDHRHSTATQPVRLQSSWFRDKRSMSTAALVQC